MIDIFLIFPIHLYKNSDNLINKKIYIIEEPRFFNDFDYHKLKLAYHRATMKSYFKYLKDEFKIKNVEYKDFNENIINFYEKINKQKNNVYMYDPCDETLKKKILKYLPEINILQTPNFLVNINIINENLDKFCKITEKKKNDSDKTHEKSPNKKYNFVNFYKWQRVRLNILMNKDGKTPVGGQWSFDKDNRKPLPEDVKIPNILDLNHRGRLDIINESKEYINKNFPKNYGRMENFIYPINHSETDEWLHNFIKNKFENFGIYEDAESMRDPFLFHSVLTPMMNIGLITDTEVLDVVLKYEKKIKLSSFEGFIRQIIGWRNYIYMIFLLENNYLEKTNFLKHKNEIRDSILWEGETNILPIDNIINKMVNYGYAHHIERLIYLGNYLLLCMVEPKEAYKFFMSWTIDAYEWVMLPNVIGMSQFADGGLMMTRPYICSSNYILKMSDYKKGEWTEILDILYYNFINTHKDYLSKNYATARQVAHWNKKSKSEQKEILEKAKNYLDSIMIE